MTRTEPYSHTDSDNPLVEGGLTKDFVDHIVAVGGYELLDRFLKKIGRECAKFFHADAGSQLRAYLAEIGTPFPDNFEEARRHPLYSLVTSLESRGVALRTIKPAELERLVSQMPSSTSEADVGEALALAEAFSTQLDELQRQYALTLVALEGRPDVRTLRLLLERTISLLRGTGASADPEEVTRLQREIEGYRRQAGEYQRRIAQLEREGQESARRYHATETESRRLQRERDTLVTRVQEAERTVSASEMLIRQLGEQKERQAGSISHILTALFPRHKRPEPPTPEEITELFRGYKSLSLERAYTLQKAVEGIEGESSVRYCIAEIFLREGRVDDAYNELVRAQAAARYTRALLINSEDVLVGIARVHYRKREFDSLKRILDENASKEKIRRYKQEVIAEWYGLAHKAMGQKDRADARAYYMRILDFDASQHQARLAVADLAHQRGDYVEAIGHYQSIIGFVRINDPNAPVRFAQALYLTRRFEQLHGLFASTGTFTPEQQQRLADYKKAVINDWYELAQKARASGDGRDAGEYYRRILRFDSTQTRARNALVSL